MSEFEERFEEPFQSRYADTAKKLHDSGLLVCEDDGIRLSERGFLFSNTVFEAFAEKS